MMALDPEDGGRGDGGHEVGQSSPLPRGEVIFVLMNLLTFCKKVEKARIQILAKPFFCFPFFSLSRFKKFRARGSAVLIGRGALERELWANGSRPGDLNARGGKREGK